MFPLEKKIVSQGGNKLKRQYFSIVVLKTGRFDENISGVLMSKSFGDEKILGMKTSKCFMDENVQNL